MKWSFVPLACALSLAASAANPAPPTFAGTFFGSLPAEACALQDVLLDLGADGRYALEAHCQDDLQAAPRRAGRWSVTWNGTCVQLVPEDGGPAQEFAIHDDDLLVLTAGSCIELVEDPRGRTLRRAEAAGER
ncbi:copper resistance protein NlpE N-terminal domain-containing protein [Pseudoxanthomonas sp.]|uniref:copper resistance protein NlpE N-terminal domain-containing protein n=1 Tax=Pseudoxanthomonas sp. TaxID=1871049 RepID=UPI0025F03E73|nr:copper resistance protein NlpE N-terminal domain-containing protein [Pseudoxanthomonas sp.]